MLKKLWQKLTGKAESKKDDKQEEGDVQEDDETGDGTGRVAPFAQFSSGAGWFYYGISAILTVVVIGAVVNERWAITLDSLRWLASGLEVVLYILSRAGQSITTVALLSALLAETGRLVVVLAGMLQERIKGKQAIREKAAKKAAKKARKRAVKKAREEERAKFQEERSQFQEERAGAEAQREASEEWLKRRDEAQQKGEPFNEEPPWRDNGASES